MLDVLGVLFSTIAVLFVVWRAAKLDELYPWFDHVSGPKGGEEPGNDERQKVDALRSWSQPQ